MKPVRLSAFARKELREEIAWYDDRDPITADRFAADVAQALQLIERFAEIGRRVPYTKEKLVRQLSLDSFPFHIVFLDLGEAIEIIAIAHHRRRPGYWISRLNRFKG